MPTKATLEKDNAALRLRINLLEEQLAANQSVEWRAEQSLRQAYDELENRVQQRTAELRQANATLQSNQSILKGFYDSVPFMMGIAELKDGKSIAVSASRATAKFLAMRAEDLPGQTGLALGNPEDFERLWVESYQRCQREGVPVRFEYEYPHATGKRWLEATTTFIGLGASGNPQFSFVADDVTERKHAEEKLRVSEERFRAIYEYGPIGIALGNLEGRLTLVNPAFCALLGYEEAELLRMNFRDFTISDDLSAENVLVEEILAGQRAHYEIEKRYIRKDRSIVWVALSSAVLRDEQNQPEFGLAMVLDVTERKRMEESLRQMNQTLEQRVSERTHDLATSEQKFRELADSITDIFFALDRDLRYTYWNKASERLTGISSQQALGSSLFEIFSNAPEIRQTERVYREVLETGQPQTFLNKFTFAGATRHFEINAYPTANGLSVFTKDVTEKIAAEQILKEREYFIASILNTSPAIIYVYDMELARNVFSNNGLTQLLGYLPEQVNLMGEKLFADLVHPDDFLRVVAFQEEIMQARDGEVLVSEQRARHQDGSWRILRNYESPFQRKADGTLKQKIGVAIDVTEQRQAQKDLETSHAQLQALSRQLIETQEQERRMIGRELHDEIGQTLTGLRILLEMAQRSSVAEHREKIKQAQNIAGDLIDRVSTLSLNLRPPMLDDLGILPALLWLIERHASQLNFHVHLEHQGLEATRFAYDIETAVYRLVQEALTNVVRYARVNTATVRLLANSDALEISIADAGVGFDMVAIGARGDASGLNGMRERVRLLAGEMVIEAAVGAGTRIFIHLPLMRQGLKK